MNKLGLCLIVVWLCTYICSCESHPIMGRRGQDRGSVGRLASRAAKPKAPPVKPKAPAPKPKATNPKPPPSKPKANSSPPAKSNGRGASLSTKAGAKNVAAPPKGLSAKGKGKIAEYTGKSPTSDARAKNNDPKRQNTPCKKAVDCKCPSGQGTACIGGGCQCNNKELQFVADKYMESVKAMGNSKVLKGVAHTFKAFETAKEIAGYATNFLPGPLGKAVDGALMAMPKTELSSYITDGKQKLMEKAQKKK